ncbi:type I 3-dehydroquinate dehydratase [Sphingomonas nostoxanthinifaciens]|uniref:type I 3-dehydroquinate dehydratase n=1 Tax=Sphingomonas nostoxanthinifaciens TaxID=2872652 RepID=UPI001CC1D563|nr:type I 3-dehydroquinate dehydratase [Sphingomonas nostoxanthinifaciens]UAK24263.1 type I 3-dehydroquinate dehydratase [Sphingomonas nostoxanthinifaciens]
MPLVARRDTFALVAAAALAAPGLAAPRPSPAGVRRIDPIRIRDVAIGEGRAKTIVSLTEATRDAVLAQARVLGGMDAVDLVEFRLDHLDAVDPPSVAAMMTPVAQAIGAKPLVVTFRTKEEGGEKTIAPAAYAALYERVLASGAGDLLDIQAALLTTPAVATVKARAQAAGRRVILSHHDFERTPPTATIVALLRHQQVLGADICKVAVMPHGPDDVLRLLEATWTMRRDHADRPLVTMAMGGVGAVSRLAGEAFGSALSFGEVGGGSAPGQVKIADLRAAIGTIHQALAA